ncbi:MAG TPA: ABC transporter substrate-binding protein [Phycisphaerales bacterium]|nr:ABC transporter substrate-binding protein [Phycisphaerales bacterium]
MKKTKKLLTTLLAAALMVSLVVGCDSKPADEQSSEDDAAPKKNDMKDIKIGVSMYTLAGPYFAAQIKAIRRKAKKLGIKLVYTEAQNDMVRQLADVEDLLSQGIDLLILNPKDPQGLMPATKAATEAGVPVIIMDSSIDPSADFITTVQANNRANAELVGEWIARKIKGKSIKMALISGVQGNPVGKERRQGVFCGIIEQQLRSAGSAGFEIVAQRWGDWNSEGGLKAMEDILVAHPDINVLLTEDDPMALGAREAIKEAGKENDILIVGASGGQKEALELIKAGQYGATAINNPTLIAETALEIGLKVLAGETKFPKVLYTPTVCITRENVDRYYDPNADF